MSYFEISAKGTLSTDLISALLWQWPFESIVEEENKVKAYIKKANFNKGFRMELEDLAKSYQLELNFSSIADKNWNESWESNFKPVSVGDFCNIRADFHPQNDKTQYDIIINPKMAFGTAHHETTYMMIERMSTLDMRGKKIFDYGTGTGILAILAAKMGAKDILAIDYDPKSVENTQENLEINELTGIRILQGELNVLEHEQFDIILANININVLMEQANSLKTMMLPQALLVLSGIMIMHKQKIIDEYQSNGFYLQKIMEKGEWSCLSFSLH